MVVKISITPLSGVYTSSPTVSHLLSIDDFNILLDIGWTSAFDPEYLSNLSKIASKINLVLLTQPSIAHAGALPYAVANFGLKAPVFSTIPVWRMAQMFLTDAVLSMDAQAPFDLFTREDIATAFDIYPVDDQAPRYKLLKYQQNFPLDSLPGGQGIVITPHNAGHMLGGTVWEISKQTERIVYAPKFNHRRERHLNPTTLASFSRPSHLIVGAHRALTNTETSRPKDLHNFIVNVLKAMGNVLIPIDTAGRLLEVAVQLEELWTSESEQFANVPLVVLSDVAAKTNGYATIMIEWMSDEIVRRFDVSRENIFAFKNIKFCHSLSELANFRSPMVILATSVSMEMGPARYLFAEWAPNPRNAVLLIDRPEPDTLYQTLYDRIERSTGKELMMKGGMSNQPFSLTLKLRRKEFLQGEELAEWREQERLRKIQELEEERKKQEELRLAQEEEEKKKQRALKASMQASAQSSKDMENGVETDDKMIEDVPMDPAQYDSVMLSLLQKLGLSRWRATEFELPKEKEKQPWDDYGMIVDTTRFMIGEDPGEGAPVRNVENGGMESGNPDTSVDAKEVIPTKYVEEDRVVNIACQLCYLDIAGLCDGDSIKRLIKEVEPRHATLVGGSKDETEHLKEFLLGSLYSATSKRSGKSENEDGLQNESVVSAPNIMQTIDITIQSSVLDLGLEESLVKDLRWNQVGGSGIALVDAQIGEDLITSGNPLLKKNAQGIDADMDLMEVDFSENHDENVTINVHSFGHPTIYVGTIMLNRLKDVMVKSGLKAEIAGGALCVENSESGAVVLLKKVGAQHIVIDGALSEEYLKVKDLLYEELVIPQ